MQYSEKTLAYFYHCQHAGKLPAAENVRVGKSGSMKNGDVVHFYLQLSGESIQAARFLVYGGVATIACAEYIAGFIEGKSMQQARALTPGQVLTELQLPSIKIHSPAICLEALVLALPI